MVGITNFKITSNFVMNNSHDRDQVGKDTHGAEDMSDDHSGSSKKTATSDSLDTSDDKENES